MDIPTFNELLYNAHEAMLAFDDFDPDGSEADSQKLKDIIAEADRRRDELVDFVKGSTKPGMTDDEWAMADIQARAQALNFAMNVPPTAIAMSADSVLKSARKFHAFLIGCEPDETNATVN